MIPWFSFPFTTPPAPPPPFTAAVRATRPASSPVSPFRITLVYPSAELWYCRPLFPAPSPVVFSAVYVWFKSPAPSPVTIPTPVGLQGVVLSLLPRRALRALRAPGVLRPLLPVLLLLEMCLHLWLLLAGLPPTLR